MSYLDRLACCSFAVIRLNMPRRPLQAQDCRIFYSESRSRTVHCMRRKRSICHPPVLTDKRSIFVSECPHDLLSVGIKSLSWGIVKSKQMARQLRIHCDKPCLFIFLSTCTRACINYPRWFALVYDCLLAFMHVSHKFTVLPPADDAHTLNPGRL